MGPRHVRIALPLARHVRLVTVRSSLAAILLALMVASGTAQAAGSALWTPRGKPTTGRHAGNPVAVAPERFRALTLDQPQLRDLLRAAPGERSGAAVTVALPAPDGRFERFAVRRTTVMAPGLAARHPEIATYAGRGVDDPQATIHLDLSPIGFHASVRGPDGTWYIDPYYRNDPSVYASYEGASLPRDPSFDEGPVVAPEPLGRLTAAEIPGAPVTLRTYRLALLTDPTYAAFNGAANVVAAKVTLMNRVNQVYEDDLGVRMELIGADLELDTSAEMTGAGGPCGAQPCFTAAQAS